ncbi:FTR1 family protein [Candidatus Peregrinibacteria bacterium]|nr:FTR1 family protein [Candidatus Peregrinibacteria bacterium]
MSASFLITFREGLEAAVIIGILLSVLRALHEQKQNIFIWSGTVLGILMSFFFAWIFERFLGGFEGTFEQIYEGVLLLIAFGMITHMVLWMHRYGRNIRANLEKKVKSIFEHKVVWTIGILAFTAVVREGIEIVIFLKALSFQGGATISLMGGLLGLFAAVLCAVLLFVGTKNVSPKKFFQITGYFLLFIAAGLLSHSVSEFQEAGVLPTFLSPLYDLSGILSEEKGIGAFLKAIFGYNSAPSFLASASYVVYLTFLVLYLKGGRKERA